MLNYHTQYGLANGIFITFDSQLSYRLLHSKHGQAVREKMLNQFPSSRYETATRENFILTCVYLIFTKSVSSYRGLVEELRNVEDRDVAVFKNTIMNYQQLIRKDIELLRQKYGTGITFAQVLKEFSEKNINFYTVHFFILFNPDVKKDDLRQSRVYGHVIRKLEFIMKFLN